MIKLGSGGKNNVIAANPPQVEITNYWWWRSGKIPLKNSLKKFDIGLIVKKLLNIYSKIYENHTKYCCNIAYKEAVLFFGECQ